MGSVSSHSHLYSRTLGIVCLSADVVIGRCPSHLAWSTITSTFNPVTSNPSHRFSTMTEPSDPAKAPLDAAPVLHAGDKDTIVDTAAKPIHHAIKLLLDSFYPINMRLEYCLIFAKLSNDKLAYTILAIVLIFSVAEYQQPGWFPRPDQLSCAVVSTSSMLIMGLLDTFYSLRKPDWLSRSMHYHISGYCIVRIHRDPHLAMGGRGFRVAMGGAALE